MNPFSRAASGLVFLAAAASVTQAADPPPLELKIVAANAAYAWPYPAAPKQFDANLQDLIGKQKKGETVEFPPAPPVDLILQITNRDKEAQTIHVGGDTNQWTFTVKGPGVVAVEPRLAFTTELRQPNTVRLEPGKSHDIPVKRLADGFRGSSRYVYPTAPGEYTVSATYLLSQADGTKGKTLTSDEVKITFADKK